MSDNNLEVVGVRNDGIVTGYIQFNEIGKGNCQDYVHYFDKDLIVRETSCYCDVIDCLSKSDYCFVLVLSGVGAVITRHDFQKPPVRMWLFGMISIVEMFISRMLEIKYKDDSWQEHISTHRLNKAKILQEKRIKRKQYLKLLDCLQLADKAQILMNDEEMRKEAGFESKRTAAKSIREFESLRNSLAYAHNIVAHDWDTIVMVSKRLDKIMTRI